LDLAPTKEIEERVAHDEDAARQSIGDERGDGRLADPGRPGDQEQAHGQAHGVAPHRGQPDVYRADASSSDNPSWFANDVSHASTSPSSCSCSSTVPLRAAFASSPT